MPRDSDTIYTLSETDTLPWLTTQLSRLGRIWRRPIHCWRFKHFGAKSRVNFPAYIVGGKGIEIGANVFIGRGARLEAHFVHKVGARISIGEGTRISPHVHIGAAERVEIGPRCGIGSFTWITDHDHDCANPLEPVVVNQRIRAAPTVLEEGVYIGERVAILRGVRVGKGSIVGTNSVVTKDIPEYSIAVGIPARVVSRYNLAARAWEPVD